MSQFTIVTRSQTTFAGRERGWYNAYARLVQNPPGTGRSIAFHTLVTGQLAVYNRSLLAKLKQSSYTRLARTLQVVWNGMNSMTEGILRLTVPERSCFSWSAIYARLLGVSLWWGCAAFALATVVLCWSYVMRVCCICPSYSGAVLILSDESVLCYNVCGYPLICICLNFHVQGWSFAVFMDQQHSGIVSPQSLDQSGGTSLRLWDDCITKMQNGDDSLWQLDKKLCS